MASKNRWHLPHTPIEWLELIGGLLFGTLGLYSLRSIEGAKPEITTTFIITTIIELVLFGIAFNWVHFRRLLALGGMMIFGGLLLIRFLGLMEAGEAGVFVGTLIYSLGFFVAALSSVYNLPDEQPLVVEQGSYRVTLTEVGRHKIKVVRALSTLNAEFEVGDALEKIETLPWRVFENVSLKNAQHAKAHLEKHGATVRIEMVDRKSVV